MNLKQLLSFFVILIIIVFSIAGTTGCANIIPPQGGERDSIPPQLIKAEPGDSALNFKGNRITLTFDEFVEIQNIGENLLFSPTPSINPYVENKLKTVSVKLKDTLEPNTTYTINFGNAIRDFTEGNPFKNFTYTFSTGSFIDSLELTGNVVLAETGKIDTTLIVMLHTSSDDSVVTKDKPRYVAKLDNKGNFVFRNLPPRTFYLYALKDENNTRRYTTDIQLFAFADKPVQVKKETIPVSLFAYANKSTNTVPVITGSINPGLKNRNQGAATDKRLKYQTNLIGEQQDLLNNFYFTFEQPLRSFDSSLLKLYTDSSFTEIADYNFSIDSSSTKVTLAHQWKQHTLYHITIDKEFAEDSTGKKLLRTDTLNFSTKKLSDYGSLKLKLRNLGLDKNPVIQFIVNDRIYKSLPMKTGDLFQELFLPGEYELRILYDLNKNGVWDPGQFFGKHLQPEIVKPIERKISVKAAWQNEFEIAFIKTQGTSRQGSSRAIITT